MKSLPVNGFAMPFLELGKGRPLVCIHGSMSDFRAWNAVLGPFSRAHRTIVPSLRHFFPGRCEGEPETYRMAQHVDDVIAFVEGLDCGPVDLVGHSRGGHLGFRLALKRPDLLRRLVLAEPGGALDPSLMPAEMAANPPTVGSPSHVAEAAAKIAAGDLEGGLKVFVDGVNGAGAWDGLPLAERQMRADNAGTLRAQTREGRQPYTQAEAAALAVPTLFVVGGETKGLLPVISHALAAHAPAAELVTIPGTGHPMMRQQPQRFAEAVLRFLAD